MFLVKFKVSKNNSGDYRPAIWPVAYPYWLVNEDEHDFILRAYVEDFVVYNLMWPFSYVIETKEVDKIEYTDEFPQPAWYEPNNNIGDILDNKNSDNKLKNLVNDDLVDLLKLVNEKVGITVDDEGLVRIGVGGCDETAEIEKCLQYLDYKNKYKEYDAKEIKMLLKERESAQYLMIVKKFYS